MGDNKICLKVTVKGNIITSKLDGFYNDKNGKPLFEGEFKKDLFEVPNPSDDEILKVAWNQVYLIGTTDLHKILSSNTIPEIIKQVRICLADLEALSLDTIDTYVEYL